MSANNDNKEAFSRRDAIKAAGAVALTGSVAGCNDDDEPTETPQETENDSEQEPSGEPEFELEVNIPEQFEMDETSTSSITVENTGNAQGQYETNYKIENGETINQNIVTDKLEPGNSQEIGLEEALNQLEPGEHRLEINDQTYDFDLLLDWGWEDVLQSEYQWAVNESERIKPWDRESRTEGTTFWESFETEKFREAVRNEDFPERLETTHPLIINFVEQLAEETGASSSGFSLNVNPITKRIYIEEEEKSRPSEGYSAGHGYNYKDNINDSLWLTDSNWPVKGPVEERPLRDRPNSRSHDIIGRKFVDENGNLVVDFDDLDRREAISFASLPVRGVSLEDKGIEGNPAVGIHPDVVQSYNKDILEGDDSELYWSKARPALLALNYASEQGMLKESYGALINLDIHELPNFEGPIIGKYDENEEQVYLDEQLDREQFTDYVMELKEHVELIETGEDYIDIIESKAGQ